MSIAGLAIIISTCWPNDGQSERLTGEVNDRVSLAPIEGAQVSLFDGQGMLVSTARTDANGVFAFSVAQWRNYRIQVQKTGYQSLRFADSDSMNVSPSVLLRIKMDRAAD